MGSLREEEVETDVEVNYFDNEPILELLSSQVKLFISKIHVYSTVFLLLTVSYSSSNTYSLMKKLLLYFKLCRLWDPDCLHVYLTKM